VNSLHSRVIQVLIAVAWQQARRGETRLVTARQSSAQHGENTASSTVTQSREGVSTLQFLHGVNTPQYCMYVYTVVHIIAYNKHEILFQRKIYLEKFQCLVFFILKCNKVFHPLAITHTQPIYH
jgi:hypothetical protein